MDQSDHRSGRPPTLTVAVLANPDLPDMWADLRTGHHLVASVPTSGGTHHYRFDLNGFAYQEERCRRRVRYWGALLLSSCGIRIVRMRKRRCR